MGIVKGGEDLKYEDPCNGPEIKATNECLFQYGDLLGVYCLVACKCGDFPLPKPA